jgi:hypothetical protein
MVGSVAITSNWTRLVKPDVLVLSMLTFGITAGWVLRLRARGCKAVGCAPSRQVYDSGNETPCARFTQKTILPIKYAMTTDDTVATIPGTMKL